MAGKPLTRKNEEALEVLAGFRNPPEMHAVRHRDLAPYLRILEAAKTRLSAMVGDIRDAQNRANEAWEQHEQTLAEAEAQLEAVRQELEDDYLALLDVANATQSEVTTLTETVGGVSGTVQDILSLTISPDSALMGRLSQLQGAADNALAKALDIVSLNISSSSALMSRFSSLEAEISAVDGDVAAVTGDVQDLLALDIDASGAFGAWLREINTQFGSVTAFTRQSATAYAGINGLSSTYVLRQRAGQAQGSLEAVATDNPGGSPLTTFKLSYDFIDLNGQVSARDLTVTEFNGNLVPNGNMRFGDTRGWHSVDPQWSVFEAGTSNITEVRNNTPSLYVLQCGASSSRQDLVLEDDIPVAPGDQFSMTFWYYANGTQTGRLVMSFYDRNGNFLANSNLYTGASYGSWQEQEVIATAPGNAVRARILMIRESGGSNFLYVTRMRVIALDPAYVRITPKSITAPMISVDDLSAISANLGSLKVTNANISGLLQSETQTSSAGWTLYQNGNANFKGVVISRQLKTSDGERGIDNMYFGQDMRQPEILHTDYVWYTGVPLTAWEGLEETYIAEAGLYATVRSDNSEYCYFGVRATILPLTKFDGNQTLRLRLDVWGQRVTRIEPGLIRWRIYRVT